MISRFSRWQSEPFGGPAELPLLPNVNDEPLPRVLRDDEAEVLHDPMSPEHASQELGPIAECASSGDT